MASEEKAHKAHVLVLPYPAQGHINPMLQFSKRLVARGLRATLATTVYLAATTVLHPSAAAIAVVTISDGFDHGGYAQAKSSEEYLAQFRTTGPQTLTQLITRLNSSGPRVDALIYDGFLPWALDVAQQFGLAGAVFFTQSCAVNNIYCHVYEGLIKLPLSEGRPLLVPGLPPLEPWESPSFVSDYGSYPGFSEMVVNQFSNIEKADWVLVNSFYKLEEEVVDWMAQKWKVMTIGPTLPSMYLDKRLQDDTDYGLSLFKPETASCLNWLSTKPTKSVIYVSFGSMAELETEQVEEIACALNETTYNFLWTVRASEKSKLPENFSEGPSEKGLVVTWSPQLEVLSHESVGCFVTHCGFNSVLEAVSLGVPVVGVPLWTDQGTNAKYVEDVWGVGVRARRGEGGIVRGKNLRKCINEVMGGQRAEEIKRNVVKWKGLAKEAIGEGGSSDKNIDEFVAGLGQFVSGGSF